MPDDPAPIDPVMRAAVADVLACPCGGLLSLEEVLEAPHARCESCGTRYPLREGVLDFLAGEPGETSSGKEGA